jgi:hypothetical protein
LGESRFNQIVNEVNKNSEGSFYKWKVFSKQTNSPTSSTEILCVPRIISSMFRDFTKI